MKTNSVSFTGYVVTRGHSTPQSIVQSLLSERLVASNNPGKYAKSVDYTNNMNYFSVLYDGSDPVEYVIHATDEKSVRELSALSRGKNWVMHSEPIEKLIQKYKVQSYNVGSVIKGLRDKRFNPYLAEFITNKFKINKAPKLKQALEHQDQPAVVAQKVYEISKSFKPVDVPPLPSVKADPVAKFFNRLYRNFSQFLKAII